MVSSNYQIPVTLLTMYKPFSLNCTQSMKILFLKCVNMLKLTPEESLSQTQVISARRTSVLPAFPNPYTLLKFSAKEFLTQGVRIIQIIYLHVLPPNFLSDLIVLLILIVNSYS